MFELNTPLVPWFDLPIQTPEEKHFVDTAHQHYSMLTRAAIFHLGKDRILHQKSQNAEASFNKLQTYQTSIEAHYPTIASQVIQDILWQVYGWIMDHYNEPTYRFVNMPISTRAWSNTTPAYRIRGDIDWTIPMPVETALPTNRKDLMVYLSKNSGKFQCCIVKREDPYRLAFHSIYKA